MRISIAIPTYRRGGPLLATIDSLLRLGERADEIVVVDQTEDHPSDVQQRLADLDSRGSIRWVRTSPPSITASMNRALEECSGDVVLFVDDDIVPRSELVGRHREVYGDPGVWAVVGQVLQPGERPEHFDEETLRAGVLRDMEFRFSHDTACEVQNVMAGNLSVRRARALQVGGFDENFILVAHRFETEFALRVVAAGGRVRFEPRASIDHLRAESGGTRAHGTHLTSASPAHSVGDYYFGLVAFPQSFVRFALRRMFRSVRTRFHLAHPWWIPVKLVGELRGLRLALRLKRSGRRLLGSRV